MTVSLKNVTSKKVLTLRYGDGLNSLLQLTPGEEKSVPVSMKKSLLQHYLSVFKGDLEIIDSEQKESKKIEEPNDVTKENRTPAPKEEDNKKDETESSGDDDSDAGNSEDGEDDSNSGDPVDDANSEDGEDDKEQKKLTEKELTKLSAEKIKELAKSLGIEVTDSSTKKALIPVILNKQGN